MKTQIITALIVGACAAAIVPTAKLFADETQKHEESKFSGTASCECKMSDGSSKTVTCSCSGALSYDDAKAKLNAQINAQISAIGGTPTGSIAFSIKKEF